MLSMEVVISEQKPLIKTDDLPFLSDNEAPNAEAAPVRATLPQETTAANHLSDQDRNETVFWPERSVDALLEAAFQHLGTHLQRPLVWGIDADCPTHASVLRSVYLECCQELSQLLLGLPRRQQIACLVSWSSEHNLFSISCYTRKPDTNLGVANLRVEQVWTETIDPLDTSLIVAFDEALDQALVSRFVTRAGFVVALPGASSPAGVINANGIQGLSPCLTLKPLTHENRASMLDNGNIDLTQLAQEISVLARRAREVSEIKIFLIAALTSDPHRSAVANHLKQLGLRYQVVPIDSLPNPTAAEIWVSQHLEHPKVKVIFDTSLGIQDQIRTQAFCCRHSDFTFFKINDKNDMSESSIPTLALIPLEALTLELLLSESPLQTANTPAFTQHEPLQSRAPISQALPRQTPAAGICNRMPLFDYDVAIERAQGSVDTAKSVFDLLKICLQEDLSELSNALLHEDPTRAHHIMHKLRGAVAYTGALKLEQGLQEVFMDAKQTTVDSSSICAIIEQTLVYLENHEFESFRPKIETKTRQSQRSE